jgi:hypothetical protein
MPGWVLTRQLIAALAALLIATLGGRGQDSETANRSVSNPPAVETLHYTVEWRLVTAGMVKMRIASSGTPDAPAVHSELDLQSSGLVAKLYKLEDKYFGNYNAGFCAVSAQMVANEGKRRRESKVTYDATRDKAVYFERDLIKNSTVRASEIDIPHCVYDMVGGLLAMRQMRIDVGKSVEIPTSDGKKFAQVRVEAQEREDVRINNQVHKTVRYEAFVFNNVLYARKNARLFVWLTDDAQKIPVQIRVRMNFPVGTITVSLDKVEKS